MPRITYAQLVNEAVAAMNEGDLEMATELFRAALPLRLAAESTQARTILAQLGFEDEEEAPQGFAPDDVEEWMSEYDEPEKVRIQDLGRGDIPIGGGGLEEEPQGPARDDLVALLRHHLNRNRAMRNPKQRNTILERIRNMARLEPFQTEGGDWDVRPSPILGTQEVGQEDLSSLLGEASSYPTADQIRQAAKAIRQARGEFNEYDDFGDNKEDDMGEALRRLGPAPKCPSCRSNNFFATDDDGGAACEDCGYKEEAPEEDDADYDEYDDYPNDMDAYDKREMDFADPGGHSALRAEGPGNPRNLPCPTCGQPNRLTPKDRAHGYQCDECADRAEGRGFFGSTNRPARVAGFDPNDGKFGSAERWLRQAAKAIRQR